MYCSACLSISRRNVQHLAFDFVRHPVRDIVLPVRRRELQRDPGISLIEDKPHVHLDTAEYNLISFERHLHGVIFRNFHDCCHTSFSSPLLCIRRSSNPSCVPVPGTLSHPVRELIRNPLFPILEGPSEMTDSELLRKTGFSVLHSLQSDLP